MVPDCIDPEAGGLLREIMNTPVQQNVSDCWGQYDFDALWEARLHWSGCPACRPKFTGVPEFFAQIGAGLENRCRENLFYVKDEFLAQKNRILAEAHDLPSAYPEIIARLAEAQDDVFPSLGHGQEVRCLRVSTNSLAQPEPSLLGWELSLSTCREFICSLESDVQLFVFGSALARDLLMPVCEKIEGEYAETRLYTVYDDLQHRMQMAIANSDLEPYALFQTIELAALAYAVSYGGHLKDSSTTIPQTHSSHGPLALPEERIAIQRDLGEWKREWKQDFDNFEDSVKAGQMELVRLIERNSRSAAAYEPYIAAQLGEPLYSRLHEKTRRAIQLAEYLYNVNQEPDGFSLTAIRMAQAYENELTLRVIWPFVNELLAAGTKTYKPQGATHPLILAGRYPKDNVSLGNLRWYLKYDPPMRTKVSGLGFDPEAISKDVAWVGKVRNEAAHDAACDRALADELRRRILCRDGILSRLHPTATSADAFKA
jgi:hypothetical protein